MTPVKRVKELGPDFGGKTFVVKASAVTPYAVHRPNLVVPLPDSNSPRTPVTPQFTDNTAQTFVLPRTKTNEKRLEVKTENSLVAGSKIPLLNNNNVIWQMDPLASTPQTPVNAGKKPANSKESTSKKSLLKRIMASATPAKSKLPRKLYITTHSNNITMTSFEEPQECIDRLIEILTSKGVNCKQNKYAYEYPKFKSH